MYPEWRYGPGNAGVTAMSAEEARQLLFNNLIKLKDIASLDRLKKDVEIIENIDIRLLDESHVLPNIGPVVFKGVWFPFLNMHEEI